MGRGIQRRFGRGQGLEEGEGVQQGRGGQRGDRGDIPAPSQPCSDGTSPGRGSFSRAGGGREGVSRVWGRGEGVSRVWAGGRGSGYRQGGEDQGMGRGEGSDGVGMTEKPEMVLRAAHSMNDQHEDKVWQRGDFEQLLRKLLVNDQGRGAAEGEPALVYVHSWRPCGPNGHQPGVGPFFSSKTEQEFDVLLQYYSLPWVSLRNAGYHAAQHNLPGFTKEFKLDGPCTHPNALGHKYIADLLVYLIQQTVVQLAETGFDEADTVEALLPLPPIMDPFIKDSTDTLCVEELNITHYVDRAASSKTWNHTCDAPNKCGWITYTAGDKLVLRVNTTLPRSKRAGAAVKDTHVIMHLGLFSSYEHMGMVKVTCVSGCSCGRTIFNTHNQEMDLTSQTKFLPVKLKLTTIVVTAGMGDVGGNH